jgi:hypothetical protein
MKNYNSKEEARLIIRNGGTMTMGTKRALARWLTYQGKLLIREGQHYAPHFKSTRTK